MRSDSGGAEAAASGMRVNIAVTERNVFPFRTWDGQKVLHGGTGRAATRESPA